MMETMFHNQMDHPAVLLIHSDLLSALLGRVLVLYEYLGCILRHSYYWQAFTGSLFITCRVTWGSGFGSGLLQFKCPFIIWQTVEHHKSKSTQPRNQTTSHVGIST